MGFVSLVTLTTTSHSFKYRSSQAKKPKSFNLTIK